MKMNVHRFVKLGAEPKDDVQQFPAIRDASSGLTWDRREVAERLTFEQAEQHIAKLNAEKFGGFDNWRLPTLPELETLRDLTRHEPAIDTEAFPNCHSAYYWTSTPAAWSPSDYAWIVYFSGGGSDWDDRGYDAFVRAVRPSQ